MKLKLRKTFKDSWMRSKTKNVFDELCIMYQLNTDIESVNVEIKTSFESWDALFGSLYACDHGLKISKFQQARYHYFKEKDLNEIKHALLNVISYPFILMGVSFVMIQFYLRIMAPQMSDVMASFNYQDTSLIRIALIFQVMRGTTIILLLIFMIGAFSYKRHRIWMWVFILKHSKLVRVLTSQGIVKELMFLKEMGFEWRECIDIMNSCNLYWHKRWLTSIVSMRLKEGKMLYQCFDADVFDTSLRRILRGCEFDGAFEALLMQYCELADTMRQTLIKRFSHTMRTVSYSVVGVVIVGYYTAIMIPIRLMEVL